MSCKCCKDNTILSSTATVAVSSGAAVITPTESLTPNNEQRIKIKITNSLDASGAALPVTLTLSSGAVFVYDKYGNTVYGNELYNGIVLKGYYGNNGYSATGHYQLIKLPHRYYYDCEC